jgi:hypothetical protein
VTTATTTTTGLWTIQQAAEYLDVCTDTARPWLEEVAIRFTRRTVRYVPADVEALVLARRGMPAPESPDIDGLPELHAEDEPIAAVRRTLPRRRDAA